MRGGHWWRKNKVFKRAAITMILRKNYGVETDLVDLEAHIDNSMTIRENLTAITSMLKLQNKIVYCPTCERLMK